jgi:transposase
MEHIAIDLGGRKSRICVRDDKGTILEERNYPTLRLRNYLEKRPVSRVVLETCSEAFAIADQAKQLGHEVRVVPATLVKELGVGSRGVKTDKKDAQVLSQVSTRIDIPAVHIPSAQSREWKALCSARDCLVRSRTKLINHVRGWLRTQLVQVRSGDVLSFPERVEEELLSRPEGIPGYIDRELLVIKTLNEQIAEADKELAGFAAHDAKCRNLMTVPGVGPVTALRFVATVDEVSRFPGAHALQSYLGLTPGENSSSMRERKTSITKAGAPAMRWLLVQAAWCAWRTRPDDAMVRWAKQVGKRRGTQIGVIALSRKLGGILYAILRDGTQYQSKRAADSLPLPANSPA